MAALFCLVCLTSTLHLALAKADLPPDAVRSVEQLLERVLPTAPRGQISLRITDSCQGLKVGKPCYQLSDDGPKVLVSGTSANELSAGVGYYLRQYCNMTIGWERGGGSRLVIPKTWPAIGGTVVRTRAVPWSYMMNVCTHSYSLVWYTWKDWERFIDWLALSGINNVLALTGQEEVQYKVFRKFGLTDTEIRGWFNGPAFLTWSRGQNEYGAGIAGPLPRSWMQSQWVLQRQILRRYRELGIVGQLPGFQGNVPAGLKAVLNDSNMTVRGATAWMNSVDPHYQQVADVWMKTLIEDFGTDHWYQLDGYFNGGTAPWLAAGQAASVSSVTQGSQGSERPAVFSVHVQPDEDWYARGRAAFKSLNATDPQAVWSFQGFAFEFWEKDPQHASWLKGFVDAVPAGRFNIVDMDYGFGQWQTFSNWWGDEEPFFGANFIWSALHNFGGTDGIKGNLTKVNEMPFAALEAGANIWGTGFTAEGIDQNPAYYDTLIDQPWHTERTPSIAASLSDRAHKRYGLNHEVPEVAKSWKLLADSMYATDVGVQDDTGVGHLPGTATYDYGSDGHSPSASFCKTFEAWSSLLAASSRVEVAEPFRYDLVNLGRDVLARLSTPMSIRLNSSIFKAVPDADEIIAAGNAYAELLGDLDTLVGTDPAFLLGSWLAMARRFAQNASDCAAPGFPEVSSCSKFYEWNARVQVSTWNPTPKGAREVPDGPIDYATKHWNGLVGGYYKERARRLAAAASSAAAGHHQFSKADASLIEAEWANTWTTDFATKYPEEPVGNAIDVSTQMLRKYAPYFSSCSAIDISSIFV